MDLNSDGPDIEIWPAVNCGVIIFGGAAGHDGYAIPRDTPHRLAPPCFVGREEGGGGRLNSRERYGRSGPARLVLSLSLSLSLSLALVLFKRYLSNKAPPQVDKYRGRGLAGGIFSGGGADGRVKIATGRRALSMLRGMVRALYKLIIAR
jgi:hypothetical protein